MSDDYIPVKPLPVFRVEDLKKMQKSFNVGQRFECEAHVWTGTYTKMRKHTHAVIDGVYPYGLMLSFWHNNLKGRILCRRWISYTQIWLDRMAERISII